MLVKIERDVLQTQPRGLWKKGIRQCWTVSLTAHRSHLHSKLRNAPKVHVVPEATAFQISIHVLKRFSGVVPIVLLQHWWDFNRCRPFLDGHGKTCCKRVSTLNVFHSDQSSWGSSGSSHKAAAEDAGGTIHPRKRHVATGCPALRLSVKFFDSWSLAFQCSQHLSGGCPTKCQLIFLGICVRWGRYF